MTFQLRSFFALVLAAVALTFVVAPARSSAGPDKGKVEQEKARLQKRFEQRYPEIKAAKADGKIGETSRGFLEAVKGAKVDDATSRLMDDENADRKALYALIADDEGVDADLVAKRAARRNFEKARKGEYTKSDGEWRKK